MLNIECNFSIASHIVTYSMAISFGGLFFFEETSSKRAGSSYNPLKKKRIDPVYRETGPKNLTTARFINGLLGGKPAKKKPRHNGPDSKLLEAYLTLGWSD